jgi:GMP synthase-like glutamine amidotransferase
MLGICYGMQTMAAQLGGATEAADAREFGMPVEWSRRIACSRA